MSTLLLLAALSPQIPAPPVIVPPIESRTVLIDFQPGKATCDGAPVSATLAQPVPTIAVMGSERTIAPFDLTFRIADDGRALGIATAPRVPNGQYVTADDLQPALAASRFAAGQPRATCSIRYSAIAEPVADAPIALVFRYLALPRTNRYLDAAVSRRAREASPACFAGRPMVVLNQAYPDFDAIPQPAGALSMTVVSYDIDAAGKPQQVRTLVSDGNAALDAAGRDAIARSRYGRTERTGCTYPFYRRQATPLAPPPLPPVSDFRTNPACDEDGNRWTLPPRMTFPEPFRRRAIEGWAVVRYDVAPWGQTGNVTVLASEPAASFGEQARSIVQSARRRESSTGATGCIDRVIFRLPEGMDSASPPSAVVD